MKKNDVVNLVEESRDELIQLTSRLLQIPSENPKGDTKEISDFIINYLKENEIDTTVYEPDHHRFNLVAKVGENSGPQLVYCGHSDTVPVGDITQWDFDPFSGEVKDGFLLGRGASDMKAGLAGLIFATVLLKRHNFPLKGGLTLAIVPDEETGGDFGVPWLLEKGHVKGDGCLIAEPSHALHPTIGQKGSCSFKLTVKGEPAHGSLAPFVGKNAIVDALNAIKEIQKVSELKPDIPEELKSLLQKSNDYLLERENPEMAGIFETVTCNVGTINGGTSSNVVADTCVVEIDCRVPFGIKRSTVMAFIKEKLDSLDITYTIEDLGVKSNANYTLAEDPVCEAVISNICEVTKKDAYGVLQWACSDARHFREYKIPVLQYGPAELSTIHGFNEKVQVEQVVDCAKVYLLAAIDFLSK